MNMKTISIISKIELTLNKHCFISRFMSKLFDCSIKFDVLEPIIEAISFTQFVQDRLELVHGNSEID